MATQDLFYSLWQGFTDHNQSPLLIHNQMVNKELQGQTFSKERVECPGYSRTRLRSLGDSIYPVYQVLDTGVSVITYKSISHFYPVVALADTQRELYAVNLLYAANLWVTASYAGSMPADDPWHRVLYFKSLLEQTMGVKRPNVI